MFLIPLMVLTFFLVVGTGPDARDWRLRKKAEADRPVAKVLYLPPSACRGRFVCPLPESCAICKSGTL